MHIVSEENNNIVNLDEQRKLSQLQAEFKQQCKELSHNELARRYVSLYASLIGLEKEFRALQKVLRNVEQLEELLVKAKEVVATNATKEAEFVEKSKQETPLET